MGDLAHEPNRPLGRERAVKLVAEGQLPVYLGGPRPQAMILEQDGKLRIRALVVDADGARTAAAAAGRARSVSWMPEHYYSVGQPVGEIFAEAESRDVLLDLMRAMSWPGAW